MDTGTYNHLGRRRGWGKYAAAGALMLLLAIVSIALTVSVALADTKYTVQPGDTLSGIAARYGVTVNAIVVANNLPSSAIYSGQVLTIPSSSSANPTPQATSATVQPGQTTTYVVQPGDSLSALAQRFGVTREALAAANNISPSSLLYVGQTLTVPGVGAQPVATATAKPLAPTATSKPPAPTAAIPLPQGGTTTPVTVNSAATAQPGTPVKYTVQYGDNLAGIAAKFNTTIEALAATNNLTDINSLEVGQVLVIIKGDTQSGPPDKPKPVQPQTPMGKLGPKWIELDLSTQMLVAYEGQTPVFSARMSSGLPRTPTVIGSYRVYLKYRTQRMRGGVKGVDYYDIPNVPNVMYFYSGYAIHGVWWHTNFGNPASHGCINLSQANAKWMYEWAPMSTMVVSHR